MLSKKNKLAFLIIEIVALPITFLASVLFRYLKYLNLKNFPFTKKVFYRIGVFPIVDHYYEPQFNFKNEKSALARPRDIIALNYNLSHQLEVLNDFKYENEIRELLKNTASKTGRKRYFYNNGSFNAGDSDYYYSIIRYLKPKKIIEIGSGFSTLIALDAIDKNSSAEKSPCDLLCIEPYEMAWLNELPVKLIRKKVEDIDLDIFKSLKKDDILFIDSSHMIKPNGDVLCEFLNILPFLNKGVYIHFHDIFTPYNYPFEWLEIENRFWNEQYLLECFLSFNDCFEVVAMLHYLFKHRFDILAEKLPGLKKYPNTAPGSFWIRKVK